MLSLNVDVTAGENTPQIVSSSIVRQVYVSLVDCVTYLILHFLLFIPMFSISRTTPTPSILIPGFQACQTKKPLGYYWLFLSSFYNAV